MKQTEIVGLVNRLEDILEEGKSNFITNKVSIDREEMMETISDIRLKLPTELSQAVWIVEERNRILAEAQTEAALVIQEAQETLHKMIDQHEITRYAEERAQYILEHARKDAREMHNGAVDYAADKFLMVEQKLKQTLDTMHKEMQGFEALATDVLRTIYDERQQLKESIQPNRIAE